MKHLPYPVQSPSAYCAPGLLGEMVSSLSAQGLDHIFVTLVASSYFGAMTQGVADVAWPNGQPLPTNPSALIEAPSGAGKSMLRDVFDSPIANHLDEMREISPLFAPDFFIEEATPEAIIDHLRRWPMACLIYDEGGLGKPLLRHAGSMLAKLLDGRRYSKTLVSAGHVVLENPHLIFLMMVQPDVLDIGQLLRNASKGVGQANRLNIGKVDAPPAFDILHGLRLPTHLRERYAKRIETLLATAIANIKAKIQTLPCVSLSPQAKQFVVEVDHEIQQLKTTTSPLAGMAAYLARHVERTLKMAGMFHVAEHGAEGEVEVDYVEAAESICRHSIGTFQKLTYMPPKLTQTDEDALVIEKHLPRVAVAWRRDLRDFRASACNIGLTPQRFNRALPLVCQKGIASVVVEGRRSMLHVHPLNFVLR